MQRYYETMNYNFGNIINTLKESLVYESDTILGKDYSRVIFHGFGLEYVSGLILENVIPNSKAIYSEKIDEGVDRSTLIVIFSFDGFEDSQDFYRSCIRKGLDVIFLSRNPKIRELCKVNESIFIEIPEIKHKELLFLYEALSFISIATKNNLVKKIDMKEIIPTLSKIDFETLINRFLERTLDKKVAFITTTKAKNIAKAWKVFFNRFAREEILFDEFPNVLYYNFDNLSEQDLVIFFITDDESNLTKRKVKHSRENLNVQSTEVSIKGSNPLYKTLVPVILGFLVSVETFYNKTPNENPFESKSFESFMRNKLY